MYGKMSKTFDIIAISTGQDVGLISQLITSIEASHGKVKIGLILIKQGKAWPKEQLSPLLLKLINGPERLSLSKARNLGLNHLFQEKLHAKHIIFPDDDSTFDAEYFKNYARLCQEGEAYLSKIKNLEDGKNYKTYPDTKTTGGIDLLPLVASVSLIIPHPWVQKIGPFDEQLGAGASYGSSEDLDYFLRALDYGKFSFLPEIYNLHPSRFGKYDSLSSTQIKQRFQTYTDGYLYVFFKHKLFNKLKLFPERALGGFVLSLLKFDIKLAMQYFWLYRYRKNQIQVLSKKNSANKLR